jgi:two-component system sensor histidine kinase/response regulator
MLRALDALVSHNENLMAEARATAAATMASVRRILLGAILVCIVMTGFIGVVASGRIIRPLQALNTSLEAITKGEYSLETPGQEAPDEVGDLARSIEVLKAGASANADYTRKEQRLMQVITSLQATRSPGELAYSLVEEVRAIFACEVRLFLADPDSGRLTLAAGAGEAGGDPSPWAPDFDTCLEQCARERAPLLVNPAQHPPARRMTPDNRNWITNGFALWPFLLPGSVAAVLSLHPKRSLTAAEHALVEDLASASALMLANQLQTQQLKEQATDLEQQRAALRSKEQQLRLLLESSSDGIFGLDEAGCFTFINAAGVRLLGYDDASELHAQQGHVAMHARRLDGSGSPLGEGHIPTAPGVDAAVRNEEAVFWRRDGTPIEVTYSVSPMYQGGVRIGRVVTFRDMTEHNRTLIAMRKLARAVDFSPASIVITDLAGAIEYVNPHFVQTSGF